MRESSIFVFGDSLTKTAALRSAIDEWGRGGGHKWCHQGVDGTVSWPAEIERIAEQKRLQFWSTFSWSAGFLNNPVSVLVVTRLHVLHSWDLLAEENHNRVKRKEQGAPPTTPVHKCSVCLSTCTGDAVHESTQNLIYLFMYDLWKSSRDSLRRTKGTAGERNKQYSNFKSRQGQLLKSCFKKVTSSKCSGDDSWVKYLPDVWPKSSV